MRIAGLALVAMAALAGSARAQGPAIFPDDDFGGATAIHRAAWFTYDDYPALAIRNNMEGKVVVTFDIGADGKVGDCRVTQSSGHSVLDAVPCKLLHKRAAFEPAKDATGNPRITKGTTAMRFLIPAS